MSGAIPAVAGEPWSRNFIRHNRRGYPRGCGGTSRFQLETVRFAGLSPRLRGNLQHRGRRGLRLGAIPAVAGEPGFNLTKCHQVGGYPRGCGGTMSDSTVLRVDSGLSPRLRGNRVAEALPEALAGAIPAVAGEPHKAETAHFA